MQEWSAGKNMRRKESEIKTERQASKWPLACLNKTMKLNITTDQISWRLRLWGWRITNTGTAMMGGLFFFSTLTDTQFDRNEGTKLYKEMLKKQYNINKSGSNFWGIDETSHQWRLSNVRGRKTRQQNRKKQKYEGISNKEEQRISSSNPYSSIPSLDQHSSYTIT